MNTHTFTEQPPAEFRIYAGQYLNCPHAPNTTVCCEDCKRQYPQIVDTRSAGCIWLTPIEHASIFSFMYSNAELVAMFGTTEYAQSIAQFTTNRIKGAQ